MLTLASDFGSPYPAVMKGVIRQQTDAEIIDIAHDFPRGDPRSAAFWLRFVLPEFPPSVHCAVIDPGVGTDRDAIVIRAGAHVIVAPDNGLGLPPARALATDEAAIEVFTVVGADPDSATFHGRDVFAPVAAQIHAAIDADTAAQTATTVARVLADLDVLTPTDGPAEIVFPEPTVEPAGADGDAATNDVDGDLSEFAADDTDEEVVIDGAVLVTDRFGNVITNVPGRALEGRDWVRVNGELTPVVETFGAVDPGERLVTVGSHGYVECDVNDGRGDSAFDLQPGDSVRIVPDNVSV